VPRQESAAGTAGSDQPSERQPKQRHGRSPKRWSPIERELRAAIGPLLAGVDEVGRGPIAGPVVACAVIMPPDRPAIRGVDDSKKLPAAERERLSLLIRQRALALALGAASVREIDRINIYQASRLAMHRALARLRLTPDHVLVDGRHIRTLPFSHTAVVHGDARCFSIACASIVAKVTRDHLMCLLARRHPGYLWERNAGYTTRAHVAGLGAHGITAHHRRSFWRVSQLTLDFSEHLPSEEELLEDVELPGTAVISEVESRISDAMLLLAEPTADPPIRA
jgi:ribonuclease HII